LHVGAGTFKPVAVEDPALHVMHSEHYEVSPVASETFHAVRSGAGRPVQ
jgi:S-adenosylmethionine:tRNA ribosyltransferase-isomerase